MTPPNRSGQAAAWRTRLPYDFTKYSVGLMSIALPVILGGALSDNGYIAAGGLALYTTAWLVPMRAWMRASISVLAQPRDRVGFSAAAVGTAPLWLLGSLVHLAAEAVVHHGELFQITLPTTAVLIGFGAQLLVGVMSFLLPSTMGGGPGAVRTGTYALDGRDCSDGCSSTADWRSGCSPTTVGYGWWRRPSP